MVQAVPMNARLPTTLHDDTEIATLANGVRVLTIRMPELESACVSVFVRSGSAHESRAANGIGHVIEHMVFKGTAQRDARRINLDAERLGAEVNAHTDKDHSAFHMRGLARDAAEFVRMLGEIVCQPSFPSDEFERERQVLLHEFTEDEDDPMSAAFKLFDKACFGMHPAAQPVIGTRRNIEAFTRDALVAHVQRLYTGANVVVGAAGGIDPAAVVRAAEAAFGALQRGEPNLVAPPVYAGGIRSSRLTGSSQTHVVLGFPIAPLVADDPVPAVAAALFGEGMSSPLMDSLRERLGLAYYAACSADVLDVCGQFVVEASTAPEQLDALLAEVMRLLRAQAQAQAIDPIDLERAHNQIAVRRLRNRERAYRRLEDAALDLVVLNRVRSPDERLARLAAVTAAQLRAHFEGMLAAGVSLALAGKVGRGASERAREVLGD
jgi:predicted Zn-dependent peptidase